MSAANGRKIVVVVPFLNEEENVPLLYDRLAKAMEGQPEALEIIFVDDGSTDGSPAWVARKAQEDPRVKLVRLSRNFGHQIAITAGMDHADGDAVVIMDADLQDPPEALPDLLAKWREGFDVVYAVRSKREGEGFMKKFLASCFYKSFHRMASIEVPMDAGDFRLVDRKVVDALREVRELHRFVRGLTSWVGFRQCAVHYDRAARHAGQTKYPVWKSLRLAVDAMTSFSGAPLRWLMTLGFLIALAGGFVMLYMIFNRIRNPGGYEPGWATIISFLLFLGGLQLVSLGLIGQYVSRIFEESKRRPLYFVSEKVGRFESNIERPTSNIEHRTG